MGVVATMSDRRKIIFVVEMTLLMVLITSFDIVGSQSTYDTCSAGEGSCPSRVAHVANGSQSLADIAKLYTVTVQQLLGANNLDLTEANVMTKMLPDKNKVLVPLTCDCINGSRRTNSTTYTIKAEDTLNNIATKYFGGLVTYDEIGTANNIPNDNNIQIGQKFVIPFPCACRNNTYAGVTTVFLTYVIQSGDDLGDIAATYGRTAYDITALNNISNMSDIIAGQRVQIPLAACPPPMYDKRASDPNVLVTNGSYTLSPQPGCVLSSCYGSSILQLQSTPAPKLFSKANCPSLACNNNLVIGNFTASPAGTNVCTVTKCVYDGYLNSTSILKKLQVSNYTTCPGKTFAPPEQEVETIQTTPTSSSPSRAPASAPSSAIATLSTLVLWRNVVGIALGMFVPLLHVFQFPTLLPL